MPPENNPVIPQTSAAAVKTSANLIVLLVVLLFLSLGGTGYLAFQNMQLQKQVANLQKPVSSPSPSPTSDPTANWKIFTDSTNTISFKYPNTWILDPNNKDHLTTSRQTNQKGSGDFTPGAAEITVFSSTDTVDKIVSRSPGIFEREQFILNGVSATKITGMSGIAGSVYFEQILISKNGKTYILGLSTQDSQLQSTFSSEFDQILSTFQFTSQTDTSNWKTYTSQKGNYLIKYPSGWTVLETQSDGSVPGLELSPTDLKSESDSTIDINVFDNPNNLSIDQLENNFNPNVNRNWQPQNIAGTQGLRSQNLPGMVENDSVFVKNTNNKIYQITLEKTSGAQISEDIFNQILSTFQFTQ